MNASFLLSSPAVIEGIGPARADALKAVGIETIAGMFAAGARRVQQLLPRTGPRQVGSWFVAAQLLRVEELTPNLAEALVDAGIRSVPQLAEAGLRTVELAVDRALDAGKMQEKPSLYNLAGLQRDAWHVRERGMLAGRVLTPDGDPIAGAEVRAGRYETMTDDQGRYAFHRLPAGDVQPMIEIPTRVAGVVASRRVIEPGKLAGPITHKIAREAPPGFNRAVFNESDGHVVVNTANTLFRQTTLPLNDFSSGTYFLVRQVRDDGRVRLLSLYKVRVGRTVYIQRAWAAAAEVPAGTQVGNILLLDNGMLQATSLTVSDVTRLKRERQAQTHASRKRWRVTP